MKEKHTYPNIDMYRTGRKLKRMLESAGYTPRMIQEYLHLSCVQPIYRWYKQENIWVSSMISFGLTVQ